MKFIRANKLTLHYELSGHATGEPLVFINSLGTDLRIWDDVASHLSDRFCMVQYDKRGHGLSDCPPAPYTMRDHALDLGALLSALKIERAVLVGVSVGGMIAQDFAATWPERVKKLVLCDTAEKIGIPAMWNKRIDILRARGMQSLAEPIVNRWFAPHFPAQNPDAYHGLCNMFMRTPVTGYTGTCEAIRDADLTEAAGTIQLPTLVLCGAEDSATTPEMAQALASLIPDAHYVEVADAGHLPCIEQPEETAVQIKQFL